MWPEISTTKQENKRELTLTGDSFTKQLTKSEGKLDTSLFDLKQLNFLQLSHSIQLCEIPDTIQKLENLQSLLLFGNGLKSLPGKLNEINISHQMMISFIFSFHRTADQT